MHSGFPAGSSEKLGALRFERTYSDELAIALSALDCVLLSRKGVYASSELTSGRRAQRLQREHGVSAARRLRNGLGPERYEVLLWNPNVAAATAFANELRARLGGAELVISPAPFAAPEWTQPAYLALWETVIRTRVKAVHFNEGWEYSNGCVHEFAVAIDVGVPTFDRTTIKISVKDGIERIKCAARELEADGLDTQAIRSSLDLLAQRPPR